MGLAERRAAKGFETALFPKLKADVDAAAGFEVAMEVNWEALSIADMSHLYDECWPQVYFTPLVDAFKAICVDDMGKEALKGALKKIIITNVGQVHYGDNIARFENGVLTLDHEPCTNVGDVGARAKGIQKTLEAAL